MLGGVCGVGASSRFRVIMRLKGEGECRGQVKVVRAWARVMLRAKGEGEGEGHVKGQGYRGGIRARVRVRVRARVRIRGDVSFSPRC